MTDYKEIGEGIVEAIAHFEEQLRIKTQVRHTSTQAQGNIIEHFAREIIDAEFADGKITTINNITNIIKELKELEEEL